MDLPIVCPDCQGAGYRVSIVGYAGSDISGEMLVPRQCATCGGTGRVLTSGWSER